MKGATAMRKKIRRGDQRRPDELTRRLLAFIDRGDDTLGREARRLSLEKPWALMSADERRTIRAHRADLDRRLVSMIERYRSPGRTSPDS
jgi:predicted ArsR family transcriptional regulator